MSGLVLLAIGLRGIGLDRVGFWTDEIHTLFITQFTLLDYWANPTLTDHPPLYFFLVSIWKWGSESESWIRLLSAVFGGLAVFPIYWISRTFGGKIHGRWAALFLIFSPFHFRYSQEARGYSLLFLLSAFLLLAAIRLIKQPSRFWNGMYILLGFLVMATHNAGILFIISMALMTLYAGIRTRTGLLSWIKIHCALLFVSSPIIVLLLLQSQYKLTTGFWQPPPSIFDVLQTTQTYFFTQIPTLDYILLRILGWRIPLLSLEWFALIAFLVLRAFSVVTAYQRKHTFFISVLFFVVLYPVLLIIAGWFSVPLFAARTAIPALIVVPILLAYASSQVKKPIYRWWIQCITGCCLALSVSSLYLDYRTLKKEDWRSVIQTLSHKVQADDGILYWNYICGLGTEFYAQKFNIKNPILGLPQNYQDAIFTPNTVLTAKGGYAQLKQFTKKHPRIWVIHSSGEDGADTLDRYLSELEFKKKTTNHFISIKLKLYTFEKKPVTDLSGVNILNQEAQ